MIPLLSWLLIRGRCRSCAISIPIRYPLSELICGGIFVLIWSVCGLDWILLPYGVLLSLLFVGSIVDLDGQLAIFQNGRFSMTIFLMLLMPLS